MISVVVYGRNDSHGYNLAKRAVICFNTLALQLTEPGDEIVFVDCNTQDSLPVFPEVIQDLLTPEARALLRVIRIRPRDFRAAVPNATLQVTEALSRNVGIRRSRPENRWILSTNTDMVFLDKGMPLSRLAGGLQDGHYQLPRFNVPEWLWEGLDRLDARACAEAIRAWSTRFHLNEICRHEEDLVFDSPGDFQLVLRSQLFAIGAFHEGMNLGWHLDANLCRRLYLLNGRGRDLSASLEGFHLNHNLQANPLHSADLPKNDFHRFYTGVAAPHLPEQESTWGLAGADFEEIRLPSQRFQAFSSALEKVLPPPPARPTESFSQGAAFNANLFYDLPHVFPYVANFLAGLRAGARIGYWGAHAEMASRLARLCEELGDGREILISGEMSRIHAAFGRAHSPALRRVEVAELESQADLFLLDFHLGNLRQATGEKGFPNLVVDDYSKAFVQALHSGIVALAAREREKVQSGLDPRLFVLVGHQNTFFEEALDPLFKATVGGYGDHVHHARIRLPNPSPAPKPASATSSAVPEAPAAAPGSAASSWTPAVPKRKLGFNVIGYLSSSTGLGVAARNTIRILMSQGYPVSLLDVDIGLGRSGKEAFPEELLADPGKPMPQAVNLFHMNPFELGQLLRKDMPAVRLGGRLNACVPFWELSRVPGNWVPVLETMDMVLAPTRFVQDAVSASVSKAAVRYYPQAIEPPPGLAADRKRWGLPENALVFGFSFDFTSVFERKNPLAVIQAFLRAFEGRRDVALVVKMNHSDALPAYRQIAAKLEGFRVRHPNLVFIDASLPYREVLELMACWDVYLSLHRAEGLGLGLMECMSLGKAAVATGWSGNMDFMDDTNSLLVGHRLVGVDSDSSYNFCLNGEGGHLWADPDVEEAALALRRLADDPALRRRLGEKAKADMEARRREAWRGQVFEQVESYFAQWEYRRKASAAETGMEIPGPRSASMRVLFQNRPSAAHAPGGDTVVMHRYREGLVKRGVSVDLIHDETADPARYDLAHLFNLVLPQTIEPLARRVSEAGTPYVVQAFQENQSFYLGRSVAFYRLLLAYMQKGQDRALLPRLLELMRMAESMPTDTSSFAALNARAVLCNSREEKDFLQSLHPGARARVIPYGAEVAESSAGPEAFEKAFGVKDFILCVGRLETRKNQLGLLAALEQDDAPLVFADGGICYSPDYAASCRMFRRKGPTLYTGRLDKDMLVSAYRAARVHVLPSWYELPGLVTLEAALYGCNVAATPHGGIRDYLGDSCRYFEPGDLEGMRRVALEGIESPKTGAAGKAAQAFTWDRSVESVYALYREVLAGAAMPAPRTGAPAAV